MFSWLLTYSGETEREEGKNAHGCFEQENNISLTAI